MSLLCDGLSAPSAGIFRYINGPKQSATSRSGNPNCPQDASGRGKVYSTCVGLTEHPQLDCRPSKCPTVPTGRSAATTLSLIENDRTLVKINLSASLEETDVTAHTPRFILGALVLLPAPAVISKMVPPRWESHWSARTLAETVSSRSAACGCQRRFRSDIGRWFQTQPRRHVGHLAVQHPLGRVRRIPAAGARRWFVW